MSKAQNMDVPANPVGVIAVSGIASAEAPATTTVVTVDREEIARLAYSYWEGRGRKDGTAEDDWFRAELELTSRRHETA